ncbi:hypothetical protein D8S78_15965 [Natrialba swarupiae]|nr:hypothetical protein [Natrialba swarupiae]
MLFVEVSIATEVVDDVLVGNAFGVVDVVIVGDNILSEVIGGLVADKDTEQFVVFEIAVSGDVDAVETTFGLDLELGHRVRTGVGDGVVVEGRVNVEDVDVERVLLGFVDAVDVDEVVTGVEATGVNDDLAVVVGGNLTDALGAVEVAVVEAVDSDQVVGLVRVDRGTGEGYFFTLPWVVVADLEFSRCATVARCGVSVCVNRYGEGFRRSLIVDDRDGFRVTIFGTISRDERERNRAICSVATPVPVNFVSVFEVISAVGDVLCSPTVRRTTLIDAVSEELSSTVEPSS